MDETSAKGKGRLLKGDQISLSPDAVHVHVSQIKIHRPAKPQEPVRHAPEVSTARAEDGTIRTITVRCTCGREIQITCDYLDEGENNAVEGS